MLKSWIPANLHIKAGVTVSPAIRRGKWCEDVWGCSSSISIASPSQNRHRRKLESPQIRCLAAAPSRAVPTSDHATTSGEDLRAQLDQLHSEAEATRSRANSTRLRLIRLSEAAEQLQRVAASNVRAGKEDDAIEALQQKQNIMLALEKSKNRIEILDKLSAKLNEAITLKEAELIENVVKHSETEEGSSGPVRIVSPKEDPNKKLEQTKTYDIKGNESGEENYNQENGQSITTVERSRTVNGIDGDDRSMLAWTSTYKSFLRHVDVQLESIETDIHAVLRISNTFMKAGDVGSNNNLQQTREILADITSIRNRILRILQTQTSGS